MKVVYSSHAVERMFERMITPELVREVLVKPDGLIKQSRDKVIAYRSFGERNDNAIAVVALKSDVEDEDLYEVVTVMIEFSVAER